MLTLSNATSWTKTLAKWGGISFVAILILLALFRVGGYVKKMFVPPPAPTVSFGKLPQISFPESVFTKSLSYSIDTITGALPSLPDRESVYKTESQEPNLLALDAASKKVQSVNFDGQGRKLSEELYQWSSSDKAPDISKKIVFNIFSSNFNLSSTFLTNPQVAQGNNLPNETAAKNAADNFLSNLSSMPADLDSGKTSTTLLSIKDSTLVSATSLSSTQIIRVDFFQKDLNGIPIVYPRAKSSTMNVYVGGGNNNPQVVQADFFHQNISSSSATYSILTAQEAFSKLKKGEAYIASYDGFSQEIVIKKVYIAYFLGEEKQDFVTPVVVFEADKGFTAYISAIRDEWVKK